MTGLVRRLLRQALAAAVLLASAAETDASFDPSQLCYRGINLSGAEYGDRTGVVGTNYTYPSEETVRYFASKGMNVVRLPFRWERLQPVLGQPLDSDELQRLRDAVDLIQEHGMAVVLDPHNFGYYDKDQLTQAPATDLAFGDFWARLAVEFANQKGVFFGLMNEPHDIKAPDWLEAANTAIQGIRTVGARNLILVPGTNWSGAFTWATDRIGGGANDTVMLGVKDPLDFYAFEFHQYLDADSSGTHPVCDGSDQARQGLTDVTAWLRKNGKRGFLGEFGVAGNQPCLDGLKQVFDVMADNNDVWLGWTYWAAGDWWPSQEPLNVQPRGGKDRPQMKVIVAAVGKKTAIAPACASVKPAG
ncbi:glycoside hydrolase family 5 protein [Rhizobium sp. CNPSo 3464]|uniref:glycoside hydrolase family 5 protein n=1 Tax=Rhizobium sp. CNPSo 3464 TaxID=3021406 RepID=UPI00254E301C|nr:glycoside hydrolase family 5 protein [Rhizobium sp. CNPSo 3464]MDK4740930.1 glycoside hydrolase family 5 protein [Rhizobium sp. CNPSo 3464]